MIRSCSSLVLSVVMAVTLYAQDAPARKPVRVSGGVMAGLLVKRVFPVFPAHGRPQSSVGIFHMIIGKDGHVKEITPIRCDDVLKASYMDAIRQWEYRPYLLNGEPVEVETTIMYEINWGG
ncbi:MAG: energy transducer TonB [Acidobacteria bacterium]|nr:energy transducer TonB [Acidobacteriota bacterium]